MKKLGKLTLGELVNQVSVLDRNEVNGIKGGVDIVNTNMQDGTLTSYSWSDGTSYTVLKKTSGESYYFDGVIIASGDGPRFDGGACQSGGTIYVGSNPSTDLNVATALHEYGHYIQEKNLVAKFGSTMGETLYYGVVGSGSGVAGVYDVFGNYFDFPTEKDASDLADSYMENLYGTTAPHARRE